jgi:soluble lytic murein transglycosylase
MIATSLAAALAIAAPNSLPTPGQPVPYTTAAVSQGQVLSAQDAALFRQGLAAAVV